MITAELATRVAEAYDATRTPDMKPWAELGDFTRRVALLAAHAALAAHRAKHREQLELIAGRLDFAIAGLE